MQTIKVTNNNANTVNNIKFGTIWSSTSDAIKSNARAPGAGKVSMTIDNTLNTAVSHPFSLPAGKTLKATIAFKAQQCPPVAPGNVFPFGEAAVTVNAEDLTGTCTTATTPTMVRHSLDCLRDGRWPEYISTNHALSSNDTITQQVTINRAKNC